MKKIITPKFKALFIVFGLLGSVLFAFQNFTPHISDQPSDVSDLYMNSALSTALKTKERADEEKKLAYSREISWEDGAASKTAPSVNENDDPEQDAPDIQE